MNSIRKKLLRWLLVGQLLAVVLTGCLTFFSVRGELADLFDDRLRQLAYSVPMAGQYMADSSPPVASLRDDRDDFVIQMWQDDGTLLLHINRRVGTPQLAETGFSTQLSDKMLWRSFVLRRGDRLIQTSQPYTDRLELTSELAFKAASPLLILILVLGLLVWISVGRGLRPLKELTRDLSQRSPYALTPFIRQDLPDEVQPLVQALNGLLARLEAALVGQRKFIADAAHELRTPLAAVQLQAQLLERTCSDQDRGLAVEQICAGTTRASHLVSQLLTLARMEPEDWQRPFSVLDLSTLLKSVVADHAPAALHRSIDLGVTRDQALLIRGDGESLRIMLGNLVDNAIRYTPEGGRVDVALIQCGDSAQVEVQDNGRGIPAAERSRVFARFYRHPGTKEQGSGLGLAIVQEICKRHAGEINLDDSDYRSGLKVRLLLPLAAASRIASVSEC